MGSKWRSNLWELGCGNLGATLCARQLGTLFVVLTNAPAVEPPGSFVFVELPAIADFQYLIGSYLPLDPTKNFPYGYPVEPDVPV